MADTIRALLFSPQLIRGSTVIEQLLNNASGNRVEIGDDFRGNPERGSLEILAKMFERRRAGDQQDVGRALKKPRERDLHGARIQCAGDPRQRRRL